jgi:hypothetical protein
MIITPLILALIILLRSRFAELLAVFAPNAAGAEPYELSMCSRLPWLIFPGTQATHDLLVPFSATARSDGSLSAFWRSRLMTLSTVYAIAL